MIRVAIIMDPIESVQTYKDTSFRLALEAQARGHAVFYLEMKDMFIARGTAMARVYPLTVRDQAHEFYTLGEPHMEALGAFDIVLMRKDPPFDIEFVYATHMLDLAARDGALVVNRPQSLRDCSEKLFTAWFPSLIPDTLVSRDADQIRAFYEKHKDIILKPLDGMGGASIFRVDSSGANLGVIIETLTAYGRRFAMVQEYLPAISEGDKRILIINGEPVPYALARVPSAGETRGNLAAGGTGRPQPLSESDFALARAVGPVLREKGLYLVGLDVIGDRITEINVTSPTCMREIENTYNINIAGQLFTALEAELSEKA